MSCDPDVTGRFPKPPYGSHTGCLGDERVLDEMFWTEAVTHSTQNTRKPRFPGVIRMLIYRYSVSPGFPWMVRLSCRGWSSGPCICASFCHFALLSENTQHAHGKQHSQGDRSKREGLRAEIAPRLWHAGLACRAITQSQLHPFHPHLWRADLLVENKTPPSHQEYRTPGCLGGPQ